MQRPRSGFTDPWSRKKDTEPETRILTLGRFVALLAAGSAGLTVGLGSYTDIVASDGPANFILPFVIAIAVAVGLGAGWHIVLAMGAASRSTESRVAAAALGLGLAVIGAGTSAWFLAGKIGGSAAIREHQQNYLVEINKAEQEIASNLSRERVLIAVAGRGQSSLENTARDEGDFGAVSGKSGFAAVFSALKNAAGGLKDTQAELQRQADRADNLLAQARRSIDDAGKAIGTRDSRKFEDSVALAVSRLGDANHIRLSDTLLSAGDVAAAGPAAASVSDVIDGLRRSVRSVTADIRPVTIPAYTPIDAKSAVVAYPQPLPWLMAILIESLPLLMLCIMLARSFGQMDETHEHQFDVDGYARSGFVDDDVFIPVPQNPNGRSRRSNRHRSRANGRDA